MYDDLCGFVEEIFTMDVDLVILMARKFFCLYVIFHQFNCEKYQEMGIPYKGKAKIITDRAYPLLKKDIQNGTYKRVAIVDDVILYGRTINALYQEIKKFSAYPVQVVSYIRNKDKLQDSELDQVVRTWYRHSKYDWTRVTDDIVRIFYCTGQPYISSVPDFELYRMDEGALYNQIQEKEYAIDNEDMAYMGIKAAAYNLFEWLAPGIQEICESAFVRVYYYSHLSKYVILPYMILRPGRVEQLEESFDFSPYYSKEYCDLRNGLSDGGEELKCRETEYLLSLSLGSMFLEKYNLKSDCKLNKNIEIYNFGYELLKDPWQECSIQLSDIVKGSRQPADSYWDCLPEESRHLWDVFTALTDEYKTGCVQGKKDWLEKKFNLARDVIGRVLARNGKMDDDKCAKKKDSTETVQKRLLGLPLDKILLKSRELGVAREDLMAAIFCAVDYGKGTLIHRMISNGDKCYVVPFLYAGEQNYKYYESRNFPALYAMYLIEFHAGTEDVQEKKERFMKQYKQYMDENNIFYLETEMDEYLQLEVLEKYGRFAAHSACKYKGNKHLQFAISCADRIAG